MFCCFWLAFTYTCLDVVCCSVQSFRLWLLKSRRRVLLNFVFNICKENFFVYVNDYGNNDGWMMLMMMMMLMVMIVLTLVHNPTCINSYCYCCRYKYKSKEFSLILIFSFLMLNNYLYHMVSISLSLSLFFSVSLLFF